MTEVSVPSSSGEIARVAQGRVRKDTKERGRSGRLDGAAPPVEGQFRERSCPRRSRCRVPKGARRNNAGIGGTHCASWVGDTAEALIRLAWAAS
jgi:hypothetical protein